MTSSRYAKSSLTSLVDSDSDDSQIFARNSVSDSLVENMPASKKVRGGKSVAAKAVESKAPVSRGSGRMTGANKSRQVLADKTNEQHVQSETEEVDEFYLEDGAIEEKMVSADELDASSVATKPKRGRPTKSASNSKAKQKELHGSKGTQKPESKRKTQSEEQPPQDPLPEDETILETQASLIEVDDQAEEELEEPTLKPVSRRTNTIKSGSRSRQASVPRKRPASSSDTERNDPATRRKLGDMTNRYEQLDLKYQNLREIGIKQAEEKFERLKKQSEENAKAAKTLIVSLKSEIATQNLQLNESRARRKQEQKQEQKHNAEVAKLNAKVGQLSASLSESQIENKTLSAKLAANRTAAISVESANVKAPGSAVKANGGIRMMGSAEAVQAAQIAQLKEDFYSDLTGLIVRGIKREAEEDLYDCIQTGCNGTLHFKLAIANEKGSDSYDDAQCVYVPQLDPSRDRDLIEILPDYLVEEITFPRPHAAKFYGRVVKALTEKAQLERSP